MSEKFRGDRPSDITVEIEPTLLVDGIILEAKEKGLQINKYQSGQTNANGGDTTQKEYTLEYVEEIVADLRQKADALGFDIDSLDMFIKHLLPTAINNLDDPKVKDFLKNLGDALRVEIENKRKKIEQLSKGHRPKITSPKL